ncbi:MAG: phosphate/phosphite/phosphonate ABC transporter substrate-binding protein [Thiobacillus sp.]|nr:MAG: phosphate/phosphite/phosphonate ABC transporter substrate-binding protein [Thiobacillus sp.]
MGKCSPLLFASRGRAGATVHSALVALFMLFGTPSSSADQGAYRLGVLPLQSPNKLAVMFLPLAEALSERLGRPVQFVTAPSFSAFMTRVSEKNYDILYLNPLLCSRALAHGYHVVAKVGGEPFTGILVVRRDSPLKELDPAQLPSRLRIGFPDPGAYAATVMTRRYLSRLGIDVDRRFQVKYFGSQDSALMALYSGLVDMAGTWKPSLRSMPKDVRNDLRVIAETPPEPQMPIAVRNDMPPADAEAIVAVLTELGQTPRGQAILGGMALPQGFVAANDREYEKVGEE